MHARSFRVRYHPRMTQAAASSGPVVVEAADPAAIAPVIEAILFSTDKPVTAGRLAEVLGSIKSGPAANSTSRAAPAEELGEEPGPEAPEPALSLLPVVRAAIDRLNLEYDQTGRSFRIESVAGGFRVMTLPRFAPAIAALHGSRARTTLSHAALETLAIISYKQPITRARLEAIRGVACGEILRSLIDRRLVTIAGRAEELGRPILYGTTKRFLELFGLASLKDLPTVEELRPKS
jgi:segregation and condensation protein B